MKKTVPKSPSLTILNFGAGVNSTALAIEMKNRGMKPDYVVFADTFCESPETYEHLNRMIAWFKKNDWNYFEVRSKYGSLYNYFFNKKMVPSRVFRDCTDKFKKMPINVFIKTLGEKEIVQYIGIDAGEKQRAVFKGKKGFTFKYPLIEWGIYRKGCEKIIEKEGIPLPPKSGCFCCPFQHNDSWLKLLENHPELYDKAEAMEKNGRRYPMISLPWDTTLEKLKLAKKEQRTLFKKEGLCGLPTCDGWCMI